MAGIAGVLPDSLTLRELVTMAEGRAKLAWDQTANLLAVLYNANRGQDADPKEARDFHPYYAEPEAEVVCTTSDFSFMKPLCEPHAPCPRSLKSQA